MGETYSENTQAMIIFMLIGIAFAMMSHPFSELDLNCPTDHMNGQHEKNSRKN